MRRYQCRRCGAYAPGRDRDEAARNLRRTCGEQGHTPSPVHDLEDQALLEAWQ